MTLILKKQTCKFMLYEQLKLTVAQAINVSMNEVYYDGNGANKTMITDGLVTCAAVVITGKDNSFSTAFTHMSSASTPTDDLRKEAILNQMLQYVLKNNTLSNIKLFIVPSRVKEKHLIQLITIWGKQKGLSLTLLDPGGDSAIFDIDGEGNTSVCSTSLNHLECMDNGEWQGQGIVISHSTEKLKHYDAAPSLREA